jgi:predicted membrane-bound mannosyltransferase
VKPQQHRSYRDTQNDYWAARSHRAHRVLAFRRSVRVILTVVVAAAIVVGASYVAHRADPRLAIPGYSTAGQ